jgi:hypothetical protein
MIFKPKKHVFISYCHDNEKEVRRLCDDLVAAGENVWWDKKDILSGMDWKLEIKQAIQDSYAVIACFSEETDKRKQSGIYPELINAIEEYCKYPPGSIFLIPVRLSECIIPQIAINGFNALDSLQHVDLFPSETRPDGLNRLILSIQQAPEHASPLSPPPSGKSPSLNKNNYVQRGQDSAFIDIANNIAAQLKEIEIWFNNADYKKAYEAFLTLCKPYPEFEISAGSILSRYSDLLRNIEMGIIPLSEQNIHKQQIAHSFQICLNRFKKEHSQDE